MIVKFFSFVKRTSLYKARKDCKDINIYLDITKNRLNLLDEAKKLFDNTSTVAYVFADINCNTVAKMKNGKYLFFDDIEKFKKIIDNTN